MALNPPGANEYLSENSGDMLESTPTSRNMETRQRLIGNTDQVSNHEQIPRHGEEGCGVGGSVYDRHAGDI